MSAVLFCSHLNSLLGNGLHFNLKAMCINLELFLITSRTV